MAHKRIDGKTPNGGDYSEIYYLDGQGKETTEDKAERCIIRECKKSGELIKETYGKCN